MHLGQAHLRDLAFPRMKFVVHQFRHFPVVR
jgi:hypothetical protein